MLLPPLNGIIARRNTRTPIPPIQCVKLRQKSIHLDNASTSDKMLAPVVVKPDIVSKSASVNEGISPDQKNGSAPKILSITQLSEVAIQPSLR